MPGTLKRHRLDEFHCCVCGTEITRQRSKSHHTCSFWKCRGEYNAQLAAQAREVEARQEKRRREFREMLFRYRDQNATAAGVDKADGFVPVCVPSFSDDLVAVPEERRQQLRANLQRLISEAQKLETPSLDTESDDQVRIGDRRSPDTDSTAVLPVLIAGGCATCGGNCCTGGGEHGHLNAEKMRDYIDAHPNVQPDEIVEDYISLVPDVTYEDSCIYHGVGGCSLLREMRANVCNQFECNGLLSIREKVLEHGHTRLFIVASHNEKILRHRFLDANQEGQHS